MKRLIAVIVLAGAVVCLSSCGNKPATKGKAGGEVHVAFVTNNVSDFWKIAEAGVRAAEKDFDAKCDVRMPTQGTVGEQKVILEDLVTKGVTGIAVSPIDPKSQTADLNRAAASCNLICMDSDAPQSNRLAYVGTKNYDAGKIAGQEIMKAIPKGGKIMVYVGMKDAQNAVDRYNGIRDVLKKDSKYQILGLMTDDANHTKARANVEDTLTKHPDVACLVGLWSYNGPAIVNAVTAAKKSGKVRIVCFDDQADTIRGIEDGAIFSTIVQKQYDIGYQSVKLLAALARGDKKAIPAGKVIDTGVRVVNKSNVKAFTDEMNKLLGKS